MIYLGILATHPIQYHAPLFRYLASHPDIDLTVYFCQRPTPKEQGTGFGISFEWDIDLTSGYRHIWLKNQAEYPSLTSFSGCDTPEITKIIQREKFDAFIVHGWNNKSCWQAFSGCRKSKTPIFVRGDSQLRSQKSLIRKLIKRIVYPFFISRFDVCLAMGKRSAEYFQYFGARNIVISPHFVDNAWFAEKAESARKQRKQIRSEWGIDENAFVFLFAGKFEPKKRPLDIIQALNKIVNQKKTLLMVGDGVLKSECEALAKQNNSPVFFTGFLNQNEIPKAYAVSDCIVLCSDGRETWGLVVNEAMACGLPAIVSEECGCVPDLIIQGKTGYSYPCGDISALSKYMIYLADNPEKTRSLGSAAFKHIQKYSVENAGRIIVQDNSFSKS